MQMKFAMALCAMLAVPAAACQLSSGVAPFATGDNPPRQADAGALKPPQVEIAGITRGVGTRHASCDDTGLLTLQLEWPRGTDYKLRDLGFEFHVVEGGQAYPIFPEGPVAGRINGKRSEFLFMWRDGPPDQQQPIDLVLEVRAVTPDNRRGPPARLRVGAAPGR
ncbi:hypothetical protein [Pseudoxanthomonas wuyuanensis]|uniref:Secreted protein n=1 Tax=Pseudoxanthomonas wuyuanensis TaxID=1073196 RepID=A0A286CXV4_9GAMM|nr:hypothetical protein [Pseudoxanthomonas wuyuanensis]KAF1722637.1 hypothetical protein CSC75_02090 [Pseudoxanthomonas wuyuanensis]SOD51218.1 hypothetical protein SAMN06296416_101512 [Pseudoxanthomonas wuyuanensis]